MFAQNELKVCSVSVNFVHMCIGSHYFGPFIVYVERYLPMS